MTTQRGYGKKPDDAMDPYRIGTEGQLKVSVSNAKQCVKNIWISPTKDSQGRFVYFSKPEDWPPKQVSSSDA